MERLTEDGSSKSGKKHSQGGNFVRFLPCNGNFLHCVAFYSMGNYSRTFQLDLCDLLCVEILNGTPGKPRKNNKYEKN